MSAADRRDDGLLPRPWRLPALIGLGVLLGLSLALWLRHGVVIALAEFAWLCLPALGG